ncbi:hypothetical protein HAX54_004600 [Datura stramonium]|uniref:Uncharacterized protein n=1 Tax=Datura stramonium TaxID=4076 RepID=A0ABS8T8J7_DATST|nr:hypothetical protein [Datura stramonium]
MRCSIDEIIPQGTAIDAPDEETLETSKNNETNEKGQFERPRLKDEVLTLKEKIMLQTMERSVMEMTAPAISTRVDVQHLHALSSVGVDYRAMWNTISAITSSVHLLDEFGSGFIF